MQRAKTAADYEQDFHAWVLEQASALRRHRPNAVDWQHIAEELARQEGDYDSYTRFALTWFRQHQFDAGKYGEAEVLATARNVSVRGVKQAGSSSRRPATCGC